MIKIHQVLRRGSGILLGIGIENAVLDVLTDVSQLNECLKLLQERRQGLQYTQMGSFGGYRVRLNAENEKTVSIFIDGPDFEPTRTQSAAIWLEREELRQLLIDILRDVS